MTFFQIVLFLYGCIYFQYEFAVLESLGSAEQNNGVHVIRPESVKCAAVDCDWYIGFVRVTLNDQLYEEPIVTAANSTQ